MKKIRFCIPALLLAGKIFSQGLSATEKQILLEVNKAMPAAVKLLETSVNINSGTLNIEGVRKTGALFAKEFEKAGLQTTWINLPDSLKRAGHLVAYRKGKQGKKLFLIGHLDTVFEPDMPFTPFTMLNDSTATGQGANDMKGGDVVIITALQVLEKLNLLQQTDITVYLTGDEEKSGRPTSVSRADFIERAKQADIALGFEGASGLQTIATGRRGSSDWLLEVTAKTGHSAGVFGQGVGYGAIYEAARIVDRFRQSLSGEQYLTFNPGLIAGGSELDYDAAKASATALGKTNIISPKVVVTGDLRFLTEVQKENARKRMRAIADSSLNGTSAKITFHDGIPAMEPTNGNEQLRQVVDRISNDMGIGPTRAGDPGSRGAGDISYIAKYVDAIDGLGASGKGAHAAGETINLKQFPVLIQRAALLIYRLTR
ncbi:MAG: M20 family metallopeptidase [Chitinophagaceae bacterium]|nr:M20 family metallopeptidase [Chitinophagaceae bacterium]